MPAEAAQWLSPRIGGLTGLVTGATGVFVIPAVPYLQALGLSCDDLVQALGLSFTVPTVVLAVGPGAHGAFAGQTLGLSLAALAPALVGMGARQKTAQPDQSGGLSARLSGVPAGAGRADAGAFPAVKKAGSGAVVFVLSPQPRARQARALPADAVRRARAARVACALWREGAGLRIIAFRSVRDYLRGMLHEAAAAGTGLEPRYDRVLSSQGGLLPLSPRSPECPCAARSC